MFNNTAEPDNYFNNIIIARNTFGPYFQSPDTATHGNTSSLALYPQGPSSQMRNVLIYNNRFESFSTQQWANGFCSGSGSNVWVVNNTCVNVDSTNLTGKIQSITVTGTNCYIYNNVFPPGSGVQLGALYGPSSDNYPINNGNTNYYVLTNFFKTHWSDYNSYQRDTNNEIKFSFHLQQNLAAGEVWDPVPAFYTIYNWRTWIGNIHSMPSLDWHQAHADPNSTTNAPVFVTGTYIPSRLDTVCYKRGTNLTAIYASFGVSAVDYNGVARPASGNWNIGAFETPPDGPSSVLSGRSDFGGRADLR